jgi:transposase
VPYHPPYPDDFKEQAVRLFHELGRPAPEVAEQIGVSHETLRAWVKQAAADAGRGPGLTSDERKEFRELKKRATRLEQENAFLRKAASFFAAETDRSQSRRRSD